MAGVDHYENFPVASLLLPSKLRWPVQVVYAFARGADDIADEGDATSAERLAALAVWRSELDGIAAGQPSALPLFVDLGRVIREHALPLPAFYDLLSAFSQDVSVKQYPDYDQLLDYCRRSANPVGRLMLALYGAASGPQAELNFERSDAICTALQLINFWQDIAIDLEKGRVYIPEDDLARHGLSRADLFAWTRLGAAHRSRAPASSPIAAQHRNNWQALMQFQCARTRTLMEHGAPLARSLPGRIGFELRLIELGGLRILDKIEAAHYDVFEQRPILRHGDWPGLMWNALRYRW